MCSRSRGRFYVAVYGLVSGSQFLTSLQSNLTFAFPDPTNSSNVEIMAQYCGGYMQDGVEKPFLLRNGEPGPWSKGFICPEGLICQVTLVRTSVALQAGSLYTGNRKSIRQYIKF